MARPLRVTAALLLLALCAFLIWSGVVVGLRALEPHPDNQSALGRVVQLRETVNLFMPLIVEDDGTIIWSGFELLQECDAQKSAHGERSELEARSITPSGPSRITAPK